MTWGCCLKTVFIQLLCPKCPSDHKTTYTNANTNTQTQRRAGKQSMELWDCESTRDSNKPLPPYIPARITRLEAPATLSMSRRLLSANVHKSTIRKIGQINHSIGSIHRNRASNGSAIQFKDLVVLKSDSRYSLLRQPFFLVV